MSGATRTVTLAVEGMTCGTCRHRVESALERVPGVKEAAVDLAHGTATVDYDPAEVAPAALADAVRAAGYALEAPGTLPLAPAARQGCGCGCR